jgi:hypothetical protein
MNLPDRFRRIVLICVAASIAGHVSSSKAYPSPEGKPTARVVSLTNGTATCSIRFEDSVLVGESLSLAMVPGGLGRPPVGRTDGSFAIEIMWTDWQAPGKNNNSENPIILGPKDLRLQSHETRDLDGKGQELKLTFQGKDAPLRVVLTYRLESGAFFVRRKIAISDSSASGHFLQFVSGRLCRLSGTVKVIHAGGYGQPVALIQDGTGIFFGTEYPAADNVLSKGESGAVRVECRQEMGVRISRGGIESNWTVFGVTPDSRVKLWFFEYLDRIRVVPLAPYALYNSWYDLRAPEMVKDSLHIMNETNVLRMVSLIRQNMIEKHGIRLNAFVLDDGWDVYKSDWVLRAREFPRGLQPIASELARTDTKLGIWFGPIGGYSYRTWRLGWMQDHGYEAINDQLCLAGTNYSRLFRERTSDFVAKEGVRYFKWDGIQFSCSDPTHGHPVGIFSRRAVLESLIDKCVAVRAQSPEVYLNITSGTWLSPWWVQYANQIWMQGADYGYADVPSFSKRDAAMTYRDLVLYDDFSRQGYWFPIANLMTHGIIKGNLERLGSAEEPLEKFTDDALLYFARGISMYELYISPDLLTDGEWNAISRSMLWARDRFPILSRTEMVGGDPGKREPYGYVHFKGRRGIIAARNPWIRPNSLAVHLDAAYGLEKGTSSLVLERVYPSRWISPKLYSAGDRAVVPLDGFETAVYEIYPLAEADRPLLAGVRFDQKTLEGNRQSFTIFEGTPRLLNPQLVSNFPGKNSMAGKLEGVSSPARPVVTSALTSHSGRAAVRIGIDHRVRCATVAILVKPADRHAGKPLPVFLVSHDGKPVAAEGEKSKGAWTWYLVGTTPGRHTVELALPDSVRWNGSLSAWVLATEHTEGAEIILATTREPGNSPMPPRPWPADEQRTTTFLGECTIQSK